MDSIQNFFKEEVVYILIALFVWGITIFITTRPFFSKGARKAIPIVFVLLVAVLILHYNLRMNHIEEVKEAFYNNKDILCLDKTNKIGYIVIKKGAWRLEGDTFVNPNFIRSYNIRQCLVE